MRGRTFAAFVFGMAFGALLLAVGLWWSGSLVMVKTTASAPVSNPPAEAPSSNFGDVVAGLNKGTPPPPSPPQPGAPVTPPPVASPSPNASRLTPGNEADRIAPDHMTGLPHLAMPLDKIDLQKLNDTFSEKRDGRSHEALDILAPKGTPVKAVAQGNVAKLFTSKDGGLTVYQFDDTRTYCYYYAHLDKYAPGLQEGTLLRPGQVLGYVGNTGNAAGGPAHLHFAVYKLGPEKKWWEGTPIDPLPLLK